MPTGTAWTVLLAAADTSSEGPKRPLARVLHGVGALAKPGAKRQTQEGVAGWPDFDPDFAEEPGLVEPYLSAIRIIPRIASRLPASRITLHSLLQPIQLREPHA